MPGNGTSSKRQPTVYISDDEDVGDSNNEPARPVKKRSKTIQSEGEPLIFHKDYGDPQAEIVLSSREGIRFAVNLWFLQKHSAVFQDMVELTTPSSQASNIEVDYRERFPVEETEEGFHTDYSEEHTIATRIQKHRTFKERVPLKYIRCQMRHSRGYEHLHSDHRILPSQSLPIASISMARLSPISLDAHHPGTTVRRAIILEAFLNLLSFPLLTHTRTVLSLLLLHPHHINPSSVLFARLFGGIIIGGLTPLLLCAVPNTRIGIDSRRTAYIALGLGEVLLIPLLVHQATLGGKGDAALSPTAAIVSIGMLLPPLLWRVYTLFIAPTMLGRYQEAKKD
ncbi:hypothetical protein P7C73_g2809, partial [Tremellales sp. Uapishka_1]